MGKSRRVFNYQSGAGGWLGTDSSIKEAQMGSLVMLRISGCISAPIGSSQRVGLLGVGAAFKPNFIMMGRSFCRRCSCLWVSPSLRGVCIMEQLVLPLWSEFFGLFLKSHLQ